MSDAPTFRQQIKEIAASSEMLAANGGGIVANGWGDRYDRSQLCHGRQRALVEFLVRCGIEDSDRLRDVIKLGLIALANQESAA